MLEKYHSELQKIIELHKATDKAEKEYINNPNTDTENALVDVYDAERDATDALIEELASEFGGICGKNDAMMAIGWYVIDNTTT